MFIQAQKNAPVYVMKQTNTFFWMFFAILGTFRHGPPENSCIFFHFPSILRCLPVMTMSSYQNARRRTKIELVERLLFIELIF